MLLDKIVVIDDDPRIIASMKIALQEYDVLGFEKGEEALLFLKKPNEIGLVLLDVYMRNFDGLHVLAEIKKINKKIAVIMMTAFGSMDVVIEALRNHADDFVEKPFDIKDLRDKIKVLLRENSLMYTENNKNEKVDRIKRFIERNYTNVSLEYIANEMCLSSKYLSRMFYQKNGAGFREYKMHVKLERAKSLLKNSSLTINEISNDLGYQNPESFMRIFKRKVKLTPTQYKQNTEKTKSK